MAKPSAFDVHPGDHSKSYGADLDADPRALIDAQTAAAAVGISSVS
jgi:hypothetical protein